MSGTVQQTIPRSVHTASAAVTSSGNPTAGTLERPAQGNQPTCPASPRTASNVCLKVCNHQLFDPSCVDICAGEPAVVAAAAVAPELLDAAATIPQPPALEELPVPTEESAAAASAAAAARGAAYEAEQAAAGE